VNEIPNLPQLLYICAAMPDAGEDIISLESRVNIGILSRDFDVSLAVVGPVTTVGLNRLRVDLGPSRVTGGFEASNADRPAEKDLSPYVASVLGSDIINARLQTTIQRKAHDFDLVVVDSLLAWPYRPVGTKAPVALVAQSLASRSFKHAGLLGGVSDRKFREYEINVLSSADMVFAPLELARELSEAGVPMRVLQYSFSKSDVATPTLGDVDFNLTSKRIGYVGYLGDRDNIASLNWFLDEVWSVADKTMPDVEFHIIGKAPSRDLRERMAGLERVKLHWSSDDQLLFDQRCRVVIEPLLYEHHVDAKLVNAMARGIPTVTTLHALRRSHFRLRAGLTCAESREGMVLAINRLMSDPMAWKAAANDAKALVREQLPAFELAHCIRRELFRWHAGG